MPPIRFLLRCGESGGGPEPPAPAAGGLAIEIRRLHGAADRQAVALLAEQCRAADPAVAGRFAPAGLQAEMNSREGRTVRGWMAWRAGDGPPAADHCPLGLVLLVETGRGPRVRSSIAWLLVHPAARRQGVATALVRRAVADVCARGGTAISAETLSSWAAAASFWSRLAEEPVAAALRQETGHV